METPSITDINSFIDVQFAQSYYFNFYRKHGFPNYRPEDYNPVEILKSIEKFDETTIFNDGILGQTMHGCGFLWTFFPHWIDVKTYNDKSLRDNWNDDEKLWSLIKKTINWNIKHGGGRWTTNRIRQNAKVYCSKQTPSNFRPTAAKYIYNAYGDCGAVYDPCGGFGGRLLGFLASNCSEYVCCEPCEKTYRGLLDMRDKAFPYVGKSVDIVNDVAESYVPQRGHFDLCFTSPPYFDTEKYSDEPTQSYIAHPTYERWVSGFLTPMIRNCNRALKMNSYLVLNVANTKTAKTLEDDTVKAALGNGFSLKENNWLALSSISGKGTKLEPIFVFEKESEV